jgi:hypothetical protein
MRAHPAALCLVLAPALALAQQKVDPVCVSAARLNLPTQDQPPASFDTANCPSGMDAYYAAGTPAQQRTTRWCDLAARSQMLKPTASPGDLDIQVPAALAMIYANGKGVPPNLPLAEKFACEIQGGWDDGTEIARRLDTARLDGATRQDLDICKQPPGRQLNYYCIVRRQGILAAETATEERRIATHGSAAERAAFQHLLEAHKAFVDAHTREEPNGTSGAVQSGMEYMNDLAETWVATLRNLESGKLPDLPPDPYTKVDAQLNAAYADARKMADFCHEQWCTSPDDIRQVERVWLKYREAWVAYGTVRWPQVSADSWRAWLSVERTAMLQGAG